MTTAEIRSALAEAAKRSNLSMVDIARSAGVSRDTLYAVLRDDDRCASLSLGKLQAIAKVCGKSVRLGRG